MGVLLTKWLNPSHTRALQHEYCRLALRAANTQVNSCCVGEAGVGVSSHHHCSALHRVCSSKGGGAHSPAGLGPLAGIQHLDDLCCG